MSVRERLRSADWSFWVPAIALVIASVVALLSVIDPHWIESIFNASPDEGSGESEWAITAGAVGIALVCLVVASWRWRRIQPAGA